MRTIRVWFSKFGDASYISHLDLQRVMQRALAKAEAPVWYSQGFNPHMYITFALPLPLGQESVCEAMDFKTEEEELDFQGVVDSLNGALPQGIRALKAMEAKDKAGTIGAARYTISLPEDGTSTRDAIDAYNAAQAAFVTKIGKKDGRKAEKQMDLKEHLQSMAYTMGEDGRVHLDLLLPAGSSVNLNPGLLLQWLQANGSGDLSSAQICRTEVLKTDGTPFC